jgi:hypothetical protein
MNEAQEHRALELQRLWKSLVKLFPTWSLPLDWFLSPSSWRMLGVDMIAGQLHDPRVRRASARLQGVAPETLESLSQMARLNEERATNVFRAVAVCYITLPIALGAFLSEAAPAETRAFFIENLDSIGPLVLAAIITPIVYFLGMWRAKQVAWAIDLHRAGGLVPLHPKQR